MLGLLDDGPSTGQAVLQADELASAREQIQLDWLASGELSPGSWNHLFTHRRQTGWAQSLKPILAKAASPSNRDRVCNDYAEAFGLTDMEIFELGEPHKSEWGRIWLRQQCRDQKVLALALEAEEHGQTWEVLANPNLARTDAIRLAKNRGKPLNQVGEKYYHDPRYQLARRADLNLELAKLLMDNEKIVINMLNALQVAKNTGLRGQVVEQATARKMGSKLLAVYIAEADDLPKDVVANYFRMLVKEAREGNVGLDIVGKALHKANWDPKKVLKEL